MSSDSTETASGIIYQPSEVRSVKADGEVIDEYFFVYDMEDAAFAQLKLYKRHIDNMYVICITVGLRAAKIKIKKKNGDDKYVRMSHGEQMKLTTKSIKAVIKLFDAVKEKYKNSEFEEIRVAESVFSIYSESAHRIPGLGKAVGGEEEDHEIEREIMDAILEKLTKSGRCYKEVECLEYIVCRLKPVAQPTAKSKSNVPVKRPSAGE